MSLVVRNVSKSYQNLNHKIQVLKNINFEIQTGQLTAIMGPSGSGKSTLLSLLSGLSSPDTGDIIINGNSIHDKSETEKTLFRGQNIGIIFQQFHLLSHLSALENVTLPLQILENKKTKEQSLKAQSLLEQVGLKDRLTHRPSELSGGEKQRICIARSLITDPKVIYADEPSGSLDTATGKKVMDLFFEIILKNKKTALLVTHDKDLAQKCHEIYVLQSGTMCKEN